MNSAKNTSSPLRLAHLAYGHLSDAIRIRKLVFSRTGFFCALLAITNGVGHAATLYVSSLGADIAPFSSMEMAAKDIQTAIDAAQNGDVIRVEAGRFHGAIDYRGKAIAIIGAGASTIIDGDDLGPVVRFANSEPRGARLDSVKVEGGRAVDGAGILVSNSSPTIQRTMIFGNLASGSGAGILVTGSRSNPTIRNNLIAYNADSTPGFTDAHQIFVDSGACAVIVNNTMVRGNGNAILQQSSKRSSLVLNNILAWNGSVLRNGTLIGRGVCDFSGSARIHYNLFFQNTRAAILTDVPGVGFEDIALISDAEKLLQRSRVSRNLDGDPRLFHRPSQKTPSEISASKFRPRAGPARHAGSPQDIFRNSDGTRNTLGFTGGPLGWL